MKNSFEHSWRRSTVPADRHKRAVAYRHVPYCEYEYRFGSSVMPQETDLQIEKEDAKVDYVSVVDDESKATASEEVKQTDEEKVVTEVESRHVKKKRKSAFKRHRERVQAERNAEIDALVGRKKYKISELLFHPYDCMKNEAVQELPSSGFSSFVRIFLKWTVASLLMARYFASLVNYFDFSVLRFGFTQTAEMTFRLALMFSLCEILTYLVIGFASRFTKRPLSYGRLFAIGSMDWLAEIAGYLIAGVIGIFLPLLAFALLVGTAVFGTVLRNKAIMECNSTRVETIAFLTAVCVVVSIVFMFFWFGLTETKIIELLLAIYR